MNLRHGLRHFGRYIWAGTIKSKKGEIPEKPKIKFLPDLVQIISYNKDGTKNAIFGNDTEKKTFKSLTFDLIKTGCGTAEITFTKYPSLDEIYYNQRIDIHLFNDLRPWWSGYVLHRPDDGGTDTNYKIKCHGYFNVLKDKQIFARYRNREISEIVIDLCGQAEDLGVIVNTSKIHHTGYTVSDIEFNGVNIQECLKELSEFAVDWVYGVDEYRQVFFKPRVDTINEEARFWLGKHIHKYEPKVDIDKIVNWARIKGAKLNEGGEQWLVVVEDKESQEKYGKREAVWTLPGAYSENDAQRWGESEINKYKDPIESAKVGNIKLEYPKPDGEFWVRKLNIDGQAAITDKNGIMKKYPITKLKYKIDDKNGISFDMELGTEPFVMNDYFLKLTRDALNNELLQQASNKQLR